MTAATKRYKRSVMGAGRLQSAPSCARGVRRRRRPFLVTEDEEVVETGAVETELVKTEATTQHKVMEEEDLIPLIQQKRCPISSCALSCPPYVLTSTAWKPHVEN